MRRRFAVPLIAAMVAAPWYWFKPTFDILDKRAELIAVIDIADKGDWLGGVSGIDLTEDGRTFHLVTDRGHRATGQIKRVNGVPTSLAIAQHRAILDKNGVEREFPHTDAEGVSLAADGTVYISFEHAHRVLYYSEWDSPAEWPSYTRAWRALHSNKGLEALATDPDGTIYTLPEAIQTGAAETLVYRRRPSEKWQQPFTIPVDQGFKPVGADFGPDGRFYLLERGLYPFGFFSRVRSMELDDSGVRDIVTELETPLGRHGNLEGLAVWADDEGFLHLTMVSDDNFKFFMRSELVEYRMTRRVAPDAQ